MGDSGVQESSRKGLSTFLADHEECGGGFDIQRRQGSAGSIVRVVCGGCGQATEYLAAAEADLPPETQASRSVSQRPLNRDRRAPEVEPVNGDPNPQGAPPTNAPLTAGDAAPTVEPGARSLRWPSWLSTGLIAALLGGGLVLIVLGVASGGSGSDSRGGTPAPAPSVTPAAPPASAPTTAPSTRRPAAIKLDRRRIAERVSIGIPVGWDAGVTGGAVTVAARNRRSEVQVYFEQGAKGNEELARASRTFLLQRHPGARVAAAGRTDVGGRQATRTRVTYPGGTESAIVVVAGGYSYLILERLSRPASRAAVRTADAVTASFRPV